MKTLKACLFTALLFLLANAAIAQQTASLTASQIINNSIAAMGGKEYIQSVNTLYTDISTEMDGRKVHWITKEMLPNKGAFQIVYQDRVVFENWYDGKNGYEVVNGEKRKADPAEFKDKKYKKNIFNELDYLDPTLYTIALEGEEKTGGEDCYKIKATLVNGAVRMLYYSKNTFYLLREDKVENPEKDSFETVLFSGYRKFGQLTYFTAMTFGAGEKTQTATIVDLKVNESISNKDFKK